MPHTKDLKPGDKIGVTIGGLDFHTEVTETRQEEHYHTVVLTAWGYTGEPEPHDEYTWLTIEMRVEDSKALQEGQARRSLTATQTG